MQQFAALLAPSANRVYSRAAAEMTRNEIAVFSETLMDGKIGPVERSELGGVPYLTFEAEDLTERDLKCLSNLSSLYALFIVRGKALEPVELERLDRYDDDLLSILKYTGKTNEQFTKLLLNVTAAAAVPAERFVSGGVRVLDPMCGRGTTVNQAMMYGWDAFGVEIDKKDFEAYSAFIQRWLKSKRLKHQAVSSRVKREGRALGQRLLVEFAASKTRYRAGELQTVEMVNTDTLRSADVYRRRSFDLVVTDAPYGVHHGAVAGPKTVSRSPKALLDEAVRVWTELLRRGGALGISWNTNVLSRDDLWGILTDSGLEPVETGLYEGFAHRVDQAISRDLMVARRPD
ncbi:SAM-dependent methyltransferase [Glycomyces albus]